MHVSSVVAELHCTGKQHVSSAQAFLGVKAIGLRHAWVVQGKLQRWQSSGSAIAGINDGEMEVMRLREENEALMDSLVRTKVELAETEGEAFAEMPLFWQNQPLPLLFLSVVMDMSVAST